MRRPILLLTVAALAVAGCNDSSAPPVDRDAGTAEPCAVSDDDGDGFGDDETCAVLDCDDTNASVYPGAPEACNGIDEDCDGDVDDDLGEGACGLGECRRTRPYCEDGRPRACEPAPPSDEQCNGLDDDCDGEIDEALVGETCGVGACGARAECIGGAWSTCTPGAPGVEACNRIDDDCDGTVDEGFGVQVLQSTYTALNAQHPQCDGVGERLGPNCNAAMHRICAQTECSTTGFGPLENSGDVSIVGCVRATGREVPYATLATFHGPCDGTGERMGPNCNAAIHRYCVSEGFVSGFGPTEQTADAALVQCLDAGVATTVGTTYTVLSGHHPGCTAARRIGPDCNAAISRFCSSRSDRTGYGPIENFGDDASVTCVR